MAEEDDDLALESSLPDRRLAPRVPFEGTGELASASGTFRVQGVDLSETGTCLRVQGNLEAGAQVGVQLATENGPFDASAEVVRAEPGRLALRFLDALPKRVQAWLAERAGD